MHGNNSAKIWFTTGVKTFMLDIAVGLFKANWYLRGSGFQFITSVFQSCLSKGIWLKMSQLMFFMTICIHRHEKCPYFPSSAHFTFSNHCVLKHAFLENRPLWCHKKFAPCGIQCIQIGLNVLFPWDLQRFLFWIINLDLHWRLGWKTNNQKVGIKWDL